MTPLEGRRPKLRTMVVAVAVAVLVAVTLFRVPLGTIFTLGMLLLCPLLMIGMHGGGHGEHPSADVHAHPDGSEGDGGRRIGSETGRPRGRLGAAPNARDKRPEVES